MSKTCKIFAIRKSLMWFVAAEVGYYVIPKPFGPLNWASTASTHPILDPCVPPDVTCASCCYLLIDSGNNWSIRWCSRLQYSWGCELILRRRRSILLLVHPQRFKWNQNQKTSSSTCIGHSEVVNEKILGKVARNKWRTLRSPWRAGDCCCSCHMR